MTRRNSFLSALFLSAVLLPLHGQAQSLSQGAAMALRSRRMTASNGSAIQVIIPVNIKPVEMPMPPRGKWIFMPMS